nr:extracellular solute-binding protein [Corynebacterium kutscheri]
MDMVHTKKLIAVLGVAALGLSACSSDSSSSSASSDSSSGETQNVTLAVWTAQEEQSDSNSWLQTMQREFEKQNPNYNITWKNSVVPAADAGTTVNQDPSAAADVYVFANDQLGALLDSGAIGALSDDGQAQLNEQGSETMVASVTGQDGDVYGLPYEPNTWFMYYNKSKLSEDDVKSFDTMLEKARVSFPMSNSWYLPAFYAAAGATFFGEDGLDKDAGINLGDRATEVTEYLTTVVSNPNFVNDVDGAGIGGLANGNVDVVFSGAWDAKNVQEALGDNYGVASLPTYTLGGEELQLKAFSGSKAVAYNPNTANPRVASEFAAFLASSDSQLTHFELNGVIPADKTLAADSTISSDPVSVALLETVSDASILQPTFKAMSQFWDPTENFGKALVNKEVTAANAAEKIDALSTSLKQL